MHFFIDNNILTSQDATEVYGPDSVNPTTLYNLTSRFQLTDTAKAFACQDGMLVVQQSVAGDGTSLLNIIIKPTSTLFSSGFKVAYYIYRGISKQSLITSDGLSIIGKDSSNNDLVTRIYSSDASKNNYTSGYIGYDNNTLDNNIDIDEIFYGETTIQPIQVNEGDWIGDFISDKIGFEVIIEDDKLDITLAMVRGINTSVDVSSLSDDYAIKTAREQILGFVDAAAIFGLYFSDGVSVTTFDGTTRTTVSYTGQDLYSNVISKFYSKNYVYVDIRSENGNSYNFYSNYFDDDNNTIQIGQTDDSLIPQVYSNNDWPILIFTDAQATSTTDNTKNIVWISLRVNDNDNSLLHHLNLGNGDSKFEDVYNDVNTWTSNFNYLFPNMSPSLLVSLNSNRTKFLESQDVTNDGVPQQNIAYYAKSYYFRKKTATPPPKTVFGGQKYYHNTFCKLDHLKNVGNTSWKYRKKESHNIKFIDEPLQLNTGTGGFTFSSNTSVIWDESKVLFFSILLLRSNGSGKKFFLTYPQKLTAIKTAVDDLFKNLDIVCYLYHKEEGDGSLTPIKIIGVNNYVTENAELESALFLGISLSEFQAIQSFPGLIGYTHKFFYLQRTTTNALRDNGSDTGVRFYEYNIMVQCLDSKGIAILIMPTVVNPITLQPGPVLVYSRDNLFFSSINFSSSETLTTVGSGQNRVEYYATSVDNKIKINHNTDLVHIVPSPVYYYYDNVLITQFNTALSNKMSNGVILGYNNDSDKLTSSISEQPPNPPWTSGVNYQTVYPNVTMNAKISYKNDKGDIVVFGNYKPDGEPDDPNYQIIYHNYHTVNVLVNFDNLLNGKSQPVAISYNGVTLLFKYSGTQRRFAQPFLAAAIIAVLIEVSQAISTYRSQLCLGFSFLDGTSFPSVSHPNGAAMDWQYNGDSIDISIVKKLVLWGFHQIFVNPADQALIDAGGKADKHHVRHMHSGKFNLKK